jgi:hypothetical protein
MNHRTTIFLVLAALIGCSSNDDGPSDAGDAARDGGGSGDAGHPQSDAGSDATLTPEGGNDAGGDADASANGDASGDSLATSFAFVGCNRLARADWAAATNPSSANVAEISRTLADVAALSDVPKQLFFNGDLVLGLVPDTNVLRAQLDGWTQVYKNDPSSLAAKLQLVPLAGNHETLEKVTPDGGAAIEISNTGADAVWTSWLAASGFDTSAGNGPTNAAPNSDKLQDDQSKMSYSFDVGSAHYVVLNTDTWTTDTDPASGDTKIGWIALNWLKNDVAAAQANAHVAHVFVFGHKPIVSPIGSTRPDDAIEPSLTSDLEALFDANSKVHGYFCAHAHLWDARKLPGTRGVWQIVAGNGGSPLESSFATGPNPYFGFSVARVYESGRVGVVSYRRPVPKPYTGPAQAAVAQPELTIVDANGAPTPGGGD